MVAQDGQRVPLPATPPPTSPPPPTPAGWTQSAPSRSRRRRRNRNRRRVLRSLALAVVVLAIGTTWIVVRALQARSELAAAQHLLPNLRSQIIQGDAAGANRTLAALARQTANAHRLTSDAVWRAYEHLPF